MLVNLNIIDLAVVKSLDLDLHQGMSVLTGETGAGKSILLTALGLALGDRADSGYVRPDCKRAEINLEFDIGNIPSAQQWLQDNDLDDGAHCFIRRVVSDDGRSKAYINNRPVTLQTLQQLSEKLVQIHGQHEHLTLLHADEQRRLLDSFGKNQPLLNRLNACFHQWDKTHKELENLINTTRDQSQREDFLRNQINELQQLDLQHYNYAALSEEHTKMANLESILTIGQRQVDNLYENDQISVNQMLNHSINEITQIAQYAPELTSIGNMLAEAQIQTEEAALQLRRFIETQEADPGRMAELENQISLIQKLSRKHHVAPEELPDLLTGLEQELDGVSHSGERITELTVHSETLYKQYHELANELSAFRQRQALQLQQQISATIKELGMPQGEFLVNCVKLMEQTPKLNGNNKIEFLVSANPGLPAKPLAKVASGGELSRISLAIQVTITSDTSTPTMIFDEVDAGIGGGIAEIVGQKLRKLGQDRQVLCVTHQPQVAAQAHHHLLVAKRNDSDSTASSVSTLDAGQRIEEIARMLGGVKITENTRIHAKEMLMTGKQPL
ncbi:MAG: DNA repair protein RecN [Gammaproteobacteria bacterium]|nr:DNA repair protein RecN [Gammaproteobacteria bacterium]